LQIDVVAAAFALHLRDGEAFGLDLPALGEHAGRLARAAEDPMVTELAGLITQAREGRWPSAAACPRAPSGTREDGRAGTLRHAAVRGPRAQVVARVAG